MEILGRLSFDGSVSYDDIKCRNDVSYSNFYKQSTVVARNPKKWAVRTSLLSLNAGYEISPKATLLLDLNFPLAGSRQDIDDLVNETAYLNAATGAVDSTLFSKGVARKETTPYSGGTLIRV